LPFDDVRRLRGYEKNTRRVVATERCRPGGDSGFAVEFYRRDVAVNRWEEALRIDALPGEAHYHVFEAGRGAVMHELPRDGDDSAALAAAIAAFIPGEGAAWLQRVGFGPDLADEERADEVVRFLKAELFGPYLDGSA
jgi:hypothetical protein